jgi:hypothetical protein
MGNAGHYTEVSGQLHAPAALPPGKEHPVHIGQEAWRAPEPVWTRWREKKCQHSRESNPGRPPRHYTDQAIPGHL